MYLKDSDFIEQASELIDTELFDRLVTVALDEYALKHSGGSNKWEFKYNKSAIAISKDFISFLKQMVFDRLDNPEVDEYDDEPQFAE